jgi:hypothetical protein
MGVIILKNLQTTHATKKHLHNKIEMWRIYDVP